MFKYINFICLIIFLGCSGSGTSLPLPTATPIPTPVPTPVPTPSPIPLPSQCSNITITFDGGSNGPITKTYIIVDLKADGSFARTGSGANGNLGNSAQTGASCCREPAIPTITASIPDNQKHTLGIFELDADGNPITESWPLMKFQMDAFQRTDCNSNWP